MSDTSDTGATRYAIYFTPRVDSPVGEFGAHWMGSHPVTGEPRTRPAVKGMDDARLAQVVQRPASYGFHATLKAPFYLKEGRERESLVSRLMQFCAEREPFELPALQPRGRGAFVSLGSRKRVAAMDSLAADCVRGFDSFRAPLTERERERRLLGDTLSARQKSLLEEFGYPYVLDQFDFHLTLAGPLEPKERDLITKVLAKEYKSLWKAPLEIDGLSLCEQDYGDPFRITERFAFGA